MKGHKEYKFLIKMHRESYYMLLWWIFLKVAFHTYCSLYQISKMTYICPDIDELHQQIPLGLINVFKENNDYNLKKCIPMVHFVPHLNKS